MWLQSNSTINRDSLEIWPVALNQGVVQIWHTKIRKKKYCHLHGSTKRWLARSALCIIIDTPFHFETNNLHLVSGTTGLKIFATIHKRITEPTECARKSQWFIFVGSPRRFWEVATKSSRQEHAKIFRDHPKRFQRAPRFAALRDVASPQGHSKNRPMFDAAPKPL